MNNILCITYYTTIVFFFVDVVIVIDAVSIVVQVLSSISPILLILLIWKSCFVLKNNVYIIKIMLPIIFKSNRAVVNQGSSVQPYYLISLPHGSISYSMHVVLMV